MRRRMALLVIAGLPGCTLGKVIRSMRVEKFGTRAKPMYYVKADLPEVDVTAEMEQAFFHNSRDIYKEMEAELTALEKIIGSMSVTPQNADKVFQEARELHESGRFQHLANLAAKANYLFNLGQGDIFTLKNMIKPVSAEIDPVKLAREAFCGLTGMDFPDITIKRDDSLKENGYHCWADKEIAYRSIDPYEDFITITHEMGHLACQHQESMPSFTFKPRYPLVLEEASSDAFSMAAVQYMTSRPYAPMLRRRFYKYMLKAASLHFQEKDIHWNGAALLLATTMVYKDPQRVYNYLATLGQRLDGDITRKLATIETLRYDIRNGMWGDYNKLMQRLKRVNGAHLDLMRRSLVLS